MIHPTVVPTNFVQTDKQISEIIGKEYLLLPDERDTDEFKEAVEMTLAINDILYRRMLNEIEIERTDEDPYSSYEEMKQDLDENDHMAVFTGGTHPDYFGEDAEDQQENNIVARAVHDYWGHYGNDVDFTFWGEFLKWHYQKQHYPAVCHRLLFSEVVGQTALCHYLPGGYDNPAFEQRAVLAPQKWIDLCYTHCPVKFDTTH